MSDESLFAIIGALFGGAGLKAVERFFARNEKKLDDATLIRQELRSEVQSLRDEVETMRSQIDEWQKKYYDMHSEYTQLKIRYQVVNEELEKIRVKVTLNSSEFSQGPGSVETQRVSMTSVAPATRTSFSMSMLPPVRATSAPSIPTMPPPAPLPRRSSSPQILPEDIDPDKNSG